MTGGTPFFASTGGCRHRAQPPMKLAWVAVAFLLATCPADVEGGKKKKKKKKKAAAASGALQLNDETFDYAIKDKGAFVKFVAPW